MNFEATTGFVIQWLNAYKKKWLRINSYADPEVPLSIKFENDNTSILLGASPNIHIHIDEITSVWFRRSESLNSIDLTRYFPPQAASIIDHGIRSEKRELTNFLYAALANKNWINTPSTSSINKLYQLEVARQLKLNIPATIISFERDQLVSFAKLHKRIIIKPIQTVSSFISEGNNYMTFSELISDEELMGESRQVFPCLLQMYIEKQFEIRAFYLKGKFFSMAIFSQSDAQTQVDFRNYNFEKMNRSVPYKLPEEIEYRLDQFMRKLNLNCGSFDLIYSTDKKYYFLEVNPIGQFGMVSFPCNYHLEKIVAEKLINN